MSGGGGEATGYKIVIVPDIGILYILLLIYPPHILCLYSGTSFKKYLNVLLKLIFCGSLNSVVATLYNDLNSNAGTGLSCVRIKL